MAKKKVNAKTTKKAAIEPDKVIQKVEAALSLVRVHSVCISEQQKKIAEAIATLKEAEQAFKKLVKDIQQLAKKLK